MEFHERKSPRIPGYDYSNCNYYFITVCTHEKKCIFGKPNQLNLYGKIAESCILKIAKIYPGIAVDKFVIMPNHVHMIFSVEPCGKQNGRIDLTHVIGQYKMSVTKKIHEMEPSIAVWQRSFHDHIIRNQRSYEKIWEYIDNNPVKWEMDCFYITQK